MGTGHPVISLLVGVGSSTQEDSNVGVRDRNMAWWGSPYTYPMFLAGAGTTPQPVSHGGDGAAATGSGAAQEADCSKPRTFPLGTPENMELGHEGVWPGGKEDGFLPE